MKNIVVFSDLHLTLNNCDSAIQVLMQIFNYAMDHEAEVIFLGDFFHAKGREEGKIHFEPLIKMFSLLDEYSTLPITLLVGNHDIVTPGLFSIDMFNVFPNVTIYSQPIVIPIEKLDFTLIPYIRDEKLLRDCQSFGKGICLAHLGVIGAKHYGITLRDGLPVDYFDGWKYTLLGHYHTPQKIGEKVEFCGSILQNNWADACIGQIEKRRFYHLMVDGKSMTINRVYLEQPVFLVCTLNELPDDLPADSKVRINLQQEEVNTSEIRERLLKKGIKSVDFFRSEPTKKQNQEKRTNLHVTMSPRELIQTYLQEVDIGPLDEDELLEELDRVVS